MFNLDLNSIIARLIYTIPAIILALSFHEYFHAYIAYRFGDNTAKNAGRLTLNPLKHLDPFGTMLILFTRFGWAKPVPINPYFFGEHRKAKIAAVSFAGPFSNLLMAFIAATTLGAMQYFSLSHNNYLAYLIIEFFQINLLLAIFNLIPVPPLDGSNILYGLMPQSWLPIYSFLQKYGYLILIGLVLSGALSWIIGPPFIVLYNKLVTVFHLNYLPLYK